MRNKSRTRYLLVILSLIIAYLIGIKLNARKESEKLTPFIHQHEKTIKTGESVWEVRDTISLSTGYIGIGSANGYGGKLEVLIRANSNKEITDITCIQHSETPTYFKKAYTEDYFQSLINKPVSCPVQGLQTDATTGATMTNNALNDATILAEYNLANKFDFDCTLSEDKPVIITASEISLVILFLLGLIARKQGFKYKKHLRWTSIILGIILIGFLFNKPLSISIINKYLSGFWPDWQSHLYWYLMLLGITTLALITEKNSYCHWFCPFGGVQEVLGKLGKCKNASTSGLNNKLRRLPHILAWLSIIIALIFRNPSISSYEVFSAIFDFNASGIIFILLGLTLITSIIINRPWCTYLCPVDPAIGFIRNFKKVIFYKKMS